MSLKSKDKQSFVCKECGQDFPKWQGKCTNCGMWDSIVEFRQSPAGSRSASRSGTGESRSSIVALAACDPGTVVRIPSTFPEVDRVLGGGLVPGALVLIGGDPGIGKSTLLLQMMAGWANNGRSVLYVSGEESLEQISLRGQRLGCSGSPVQFLGETNVETILARLDEHKPAIVAIDSIQTMFCEEPASTPGSVTQVRESTARLLRYAKEHGTVIVLVGHVTKDGSLAGPRLLEHMVDTVIYFEGDSNYQYRILRSVKNRFGASGEIAILSMSDKGLAEVKNASELFLQSGPQAQIGTAVAPILEGSRVLVVELQALVNRTHFGIPQRVASGVSPKKLSLLIAVLERYSGIMLGDHDIFFNIAGGLTVAEPAIDLGVAAALLSSFRNKPVPKGVACIGEIGLGGEIRPVNNMAARLRELAHLGFSSCIVPAPGPKTDWASQATKTKLVPVKGIGNLADVLFV
jgi:DNA repair protein RadA/Sms